MTPFIKTTINIYSIFIQCFNFLHGDAHGSGRSFRYGNLTFFNATAVTNLGDTGRCFSIDDQCCYFHDDYDMSHAVWLLDAFFSLSTGRTMPFVRKGCIKNRNLNSFGIMYIKVWTMEYIDMTKEQLMDELVKMRQRVSVFEQTEKDLKKREARFRIQFRSMPTPTFIWRISGDKLILADINDAAVSFTKGEIDNLIDLIGVEASRFYRGMPDYLNDMDRCLAEKITVINEYPYSLRTTGEKKHVFIKHVFVEPDTVMVQMEDITLQKQEQEHLKYISVHDSLTGLYNRLYADTEVDRLRDSRRYPISVIVFDVDGLKTVNDSEGHAAGDQLILDTAEVLRKSFRPEDMVARTGGDEFMVVLPFVDEVTLEGVLSRFKKSLERCNTASNRPLSISFGTATAVSGEMLNDSIRQADMLMYQNKAQKKVERL